MYWANFLHIYQPPGQSEKVLKEVVNESYRPLFKGLLGLSEFKINLNINANLAETLNRKGYSDVLEAIEKLAEAGRLEFTETAKYHPLLPFLEEKEIENQIRQNHRTNRRIFGEVYEPVCFFPPEMAYSEKVGRTVADMGYSLILLDQFSYKAGKERPGRDRLFSIGNTDLKTVFREKRISNAIMSGVVRSPQEFHRLLKQKEKEYFCTAMDGETFGHHRPGLEKTLFKIISFKEPEQIFLSDLLELLPSGKGIQPVNSSWASSRKQIEEGTQFCSWRDPENRVHRLQWEFVNYLKEKAGHKKIPSETREKISRAYASDQFFWASGEPWWSIEMIEKGAWFVLSALRGLPGIKKKEVEKGEDLYKAILYAAFSWQRSGKIGEKAQKYREKTRIPFKQRTLKKGKPEVYYAFIDKMEEKMWEAARQKNFERAILWRDAVWKLETENDIYDAIHAVDLLRMEVSDRELTDLMEKYKEKYEEIRPGQPEKREL